MRSGVADLTASGIPARSTGQVQNSLRENDFMDQAAGPVREKVTDFSAVVSEPDAWECKGLVPRSSNR